MSIRILPLRVRRQVKATCLCMNHLAQCLAQSPCATNGTVLHFPFFLRSWVQSASLCSRRGGCYWYGTNRLNSLGWSEGISQRISNTVISVLKAAKSPLLGTQKVLIEFPFEQDLTCKTMPLLCPEQGLFATQGSQGPRPGVTSVFLHGQGCTVVAAFLTI